MTAHVAGLRRHYVFGGTTVCIDLVKLASQALPGVLYQPTEGQALLDEWRETCT